jgi:IS605 OrfB family transposase
MPVRYYHGTFTLNGRRLRLPIARGCPPLGVRLDRDVPYPARQVRSVTLVNEGHRLYVQVTAEVPVASYPAGQEPDPGRVAGADPGVIHPFAVAGPDGQGLLVSGRAIRAETYLHLADTKRRARATARRAPKPGQKGSRRWRKTRARQRNQESAHRRRVAQAQHEAAAAVIAWSVARRVGTLKIGDPRGVLNLDAGRRHNKRVRDWRIGHLLRTLQDKAEQAGITAILVDERGTSSTCPSCSKRVPKPSGRTFHCPYCAFTGHHDLVGGANIATRSPGGGPIRSGDSARFPDLITHRRAAPMTAAQKGLLAGRGPPHPDVGTSLAHRKPRDARIARLHPGNRAILKRHGTSPTTRRRPASGARRLELVRRGGQAGPADRGAVAPGPDRPDGQGRQDRPGAGEGQDAAHREGGHDAGHRARRADRQDRPGRPDGQDRPGRADRQDGAGRADGQDGARARRPVLPVTRDGHAPMIAG